MRKLKNLVLIFTNNEEMVLSPDMIKDISISDITEHLSRIDEDTILNYKVAGYISLNLEKNGFCKDQKDMFISVINDETKEVRFLNRVTYRSEDDSGSGDELEAVLEDGERYLTLFERIAYFLDIQRIFIFYEDGGFDCYHNLFEADPEGRNIRQRIINITGDSLHFVIQ